MKNYNLLNYSQNIPSLGHDRNIVSCLSNKDMNTFGSWVIPCQFQIMRLK